MLQEFDLVIRGGTIVDGSGDPPFRGDVAILGDRIASIGNVEGRGKEEIDAQGRIVTPGFVDVHTHYDGQVTWEDRLTPSSEHGVTTVVMGNCGVGFAPARAGDRRLAIKLMEGVEDIPEVVMAEGLPWNWETFPEYLDALANRETDIDFAAQLPHSPLRIYVMGKRGANLEPPNEQDLAEMRRITSEAIQAGALGVSTSRNLAHRFRDGRPAPSIVTEVDELTALAAGLHDASAGVFQIIPNADEPAETEWSIITTLNDVSQRPVNFSLFTNSFKGGWDWQLLVDGLAEAEADGRRIKGQFLPRPAGLLFGLDLNYHPFSLNPSYREIEKLPLEQKVMRMRDPDFRARLLSEEPEDPNAFLVWIVKQTQILFRLDDPPDYTPAFDQNIKARAARAGIDEREFLYDELLRQDGRAILYCPVGNTEENRLDAAVRNFFGKPGTVLGLGDGGAHYGIICDAAYPTFLLTVHVREKGTLSIENAVKMLCHDTASSVDLDDRGLIKVGYKADLNVIDLDRLTLHSPTVKSDLPANGKRLSQKAEGYDTTIVSGTVTYLNGLSTGALPGRLVRGAKSAPGGEDSLRT